MSLSCTVSEIWRDIGQKSPFEPTAPLFGAPLGVIQFCRDLWRQKIRIPGLSYGFVCVILRLADKLYVSPPNLRIRGHLPAPIINGGDSRWKWPTFRLSRARGLDLHLGSGYTAYQHVSLVDLYLHTKFHWNRINFLWTDVMTDIWDLFY